jgi:general stress protein YciG
MASSNPGNFANDKNKASMAGKKGAMAQPTAAKAKGGRNSHRGSSSTSSS